MSEHTRRQMLRAGLGAVAGSVVLGGSTASRRPRHGLTGRSRRAHGPGWRGDPGTETAPVGPVMGTDDGSGRGSPVLVHAKPRVDGKPKVTAPAISDEFTGADLGEQWVWQANAEKSWWSLRRRPGRLTLTCLPSPDTHDLRLPVPPGHAPRRTRSASRAGRARSR